MGVLRENSIRVNSRGIPSDTWQKPDMPGKLSRIRKSHEIMTLAVRPEAQGIKICRPDEVFAEHGSETGKSLLLKDSGGAYVGIPT